MTTTPDTQPIEIVDKHYPELLIELIDHLTKVLIERGLDKKSAGVAALDCAEYLRKHWGGQPIYFPKGRLIGLSARDREIWDKWRGDNTHELCREYNLTLARLYQILKAMREEEVTKRQGRLFEG